MIKSSIAFNIRRDIPRPFARTACNSPFAWIVVIAVERVDHSIGGAHSGHRVSPPFLSTSIPNNSQFTYFYSFAYLLIIMTGEMITLYVHKWSTTMHFHLSAGLLAFSVALRWAFRLRLRNESFAIIVTAASVHLVLSLCCSISVKNFRDGQQNGQGAMRFLKQYRWIRQQ